MHARAGLLDVRVEFSDGSAVVRLAGELDVASSSLLRDTLVHVADDRSGERVILDVVDLDFVDSSGLTAIIDGLTRLREMGGDLVVRSPRRGVRRVMEISGVEKLLTIES